MDIKKDLLNFLRGSKYSTFPGGLILGNWKIEVNPPFGFVVKNSKDAQEYHFYAESDGWVTGVYAINKDEPKMVAMNAIGQVIGVPMLMDKKSTQNMARSYALREKHQKEGLTQAEMEELLILNGIVSKK